MKRLVVTPNIGQSSVAGPRECIVDMRACEHYYRMEAKKIDVLSLWRIESMSGLGMYVVRSGLHRNREE
jgi:hypothetical protein